MPTAEALMSATTAAIETMFFSSVVGPADPLQSDRISMAYQLQFRGDVHGDFMLGISRESAIALAANFLGENAEGISENSVQDVVGELTNMVAGRLLSNLEPGRKFELTHPQPGSAAELRQQLRCGEAQAFEFDDGMVAVRMRM